MSGIILYYLYYYYLLKLRILSRIYRSVVVFIDEFDLLEEEK